MNRTELKECQISVGMILNIVTDRYRSLPIATDRYHATTKGDVEKVADRSDDLTGAEATI